MNFFALSMWRRIRIFIIVMPSKPFLGRKRRWSMGHNNGSGTPTQQFSVRENQGQTGQYYDRSPPLMTEVLERYRACSILFAWLNL